VEGQDPLPRYLVNHRGNAAQAKEKGNDGEASHGFALPGSPIQTFA
jgi:hypothetical protein